MQIGITNPLREFLRWKPFPPNSEEEPLFCWDAHRVKVDGRMMLVVCNAANRFAGVTAMRGADWKHLEDACRDLVAASMLECGFSAAAVGQYLARAGAPEFGRTHGRKAVGCMNRMVDTLLWTQCDHGSQFQAFLTHLVNVDDIGSCAGREGYGYAAERMAEDLLGIGIDPFGRAPREAESNDEDAGSGDAEANRHWLGLPAWEREILLTSAFCPRCGMAEFAPGYAVKRERWGLVIEGACKVCGGRIARAREDD